MQQNGLTYHLLQRLLDRLESEGQTFGVDRHLQLHRLLQQLPADCPPERLRSLLAPVLAKSREEQQAFYGIFKETWGEVQAMHDWVPPATTATQEAKEEYRWRQVAISLGAIFLLTILGLLLLISKAEKEAKTEFSQTVSLYDRQPAFIAGDTLLDQVSSVVFVANDSPDSLRTKLVYYQLQDSLRLLMTPLDTIGVDSVVLVLRNAKGDSLYWQIKSILGTRPSPTVNTPSEAARFIPIEGPPFPHDIFSLAVQPLTPTEQFIHDYLPWIKAALLLLFTALLAAVLIWRERRRRKLVAELEQRTQPPYLWDIKFAETAEIDFGASFGLLLNQLRQRTNTESRELDVPATIDGTIKKGGMVHFKYRQHTRPPEYLLLIDQNSRHNHRARLFDELYVQLLAEEVIISRYFYNGDLRLCFNDEQPHGIHLQDLASKYPDARLLVLGNGQSLLNPVSGRLDRWTALLNRWNDRALLSPAAATSWGHREQQIAELLPVLPANLASLSFLIDQLDAGEEGEIDRWKQVVGQQALPPVRLSANGLIESLKTHFEQPMLHWIAACAVYPDLQFELTCQLGQLLSTGEQKLLTAQNINRLNQLPWFIAGQMPTAVRMLLLDYFERENPALLLEVRQFLHSSLENSKPPTNSAAANDHQLQLALNEWFFTQNAKRKAELEKKIAQQLRSGAEADFTVIKFLERERSPLDFIVPDSWKKYLSHSDYPVLDWQELKKDLRWALPLWLFVLLVTVWYQSAELEGCENTVIYQAQTLCLDSPVKELLYLEQLALDSIRSKKLEALDSLQQQMVAVLTRPENQGDTSITNAHHEVYLNLFVDLYNRGTALHLISKDSACYYFDFATQFIVIPSEFGEQWAETKIWCSDDQQPIADFAFPTNSCCAPCNLTITNQSVNASSFNWRLGDGLTTSEANPSHVYTQPGEYEIQLIAINEWGADTLTQTVEIRACAEDEVNNPAYRGRVIDANTGEPIPNAIIQAGPSQDIRNQDLANQPSLRTNEQGYYTIAAGQWSGLTDELQMRISATGYRDTILRRIAQAELAPITLELDVAAPSVVGRTTPTSEEPVPATPVPAATTIADIAKNMVSVAGGTFTMGCQEGRDTDCYGDEKPAHEVTLSSFSISKYEVTQAQWRAVMGSDPPELNNKGCDQCPVERVSWNDIQEFLQKLNAQTGQNYRLPTEAEWEYAARGGNKSQDYLYSGSNDITEVAWYEDNYAQGNTHGSEKATRPVGEKKPNELGLYDMSGNVWEWCSDWFGENYYQNSPQKNPRGPDEGPHRVYRGGGWLSFAQNCRAAYRDRAAPTYRYDDLGFRLARS